MDEFVVSVLATAAFVLVGYIIGEAVWLLVGRWWRGR